MKRSDSQESKELEYFWRFREAYKQVVMCCNNQISRKVQNMSHFDLCGDTIQRFPDIPKYGQSLLLIETQKNCPISSNHNFEAVQPPEDFDELELSLELKMDKEAPPGINSAATIKRKKGCTCKKTKCLKMYCECFSLGKVCTQDCNCLGCQNCKEHSDALLKAQELARNKVPEGRSVSKGCNCKKSQCQKKYC